MFCLEEGAPYTETTQVRTPPPYQQIFLFKENNRLQTLSVHLASHLVSMFYLTSHVGRNYRVLVFFTASSINSLMCSGYDPTSGLSAAEIFSSTSEEHPS